MASCPFFPPLWGVSQFGTAGMGNGKTSPRPWGCFYDACRHRAASQVFPTPVGAISQKLGLGLSLSCLFFGGIRYVSGRYRIP